MKKIYQLFQNSEENIDKKDKLVAVKLQCKNKRFKILFIKKF